MGRKGRKWMAAVLAGAMLAASMTGCGQSGGSAKGSEGKEKQKITLMHMQTLESAKQGNAEAIAFQKCVENFKKSHPDVEVVEEIVSQEAGYETKIKTLAAANELPDLFMALPSMMSSFYDNGQVMDIAPLLKKDTEWSGKFVDGAFGDFTFGDQVLGVPRCSIANHVLYWNQDIFKECGIQEFPKNEKEFKNAVQVLKDKGYIPMACGNKGKYLIASQIMPGILFKFVDDSWYNSLKNYEGASFEDPDALAAIAYMEDLMKMGLFNQDVNSLEPNQARQLYYSKKAAMYCEGSWSVANFIAEGSEELLDATEMTIFPPVEGKEDLENQIIGGQGWGMAVNSSLEGGKLDLAVDFLKELSADDIQAGLVEGGSLATIKEVPYDESKLSPFYKKFLDMYNSHTKIVGCPEVQLSTAYMDASYTGYQELSIGALDAKGLAAKLEAAHEKAEK